MISATNKHRTLVIHTTDRADRAAIERVATGALRRGDNISIIIEIRGRHAPLGRIRPSAGGEFLTGPGHAPVGHSSIPAALNAALGNFDEAFRDLA